MADSKSHRPGVSARLRRWESVLLMVFLVDFFEDRYLFPTPAIPPWSKILIKMAVVVGVLGIFLRFLNRRIDGGVSTAHSLTGRGFLPSLALHALLLGAVFVGYWWLKIGGVPWK